MLNKAICKQCVNKYRLHDVLSTPEWREPFLWGFGDKRRL
jgi:hypothetical protein